MIGISEWREQCPAGLSPSPAQCSGKGDWHFDGNAPADALQPRAHKFWLVLAKGEGQQGRAHSNLVLAPSSGLSKVHEAALAAATAPLHNHPRALDFDEQESILEQAACRPELDPGDAVFFLECVLFNISEHADGERQRPESI